MESVRTGAEVSRTLLVPLGGDEGPESARLELSLRTRELRVSWRVRGSIGPVASGEVGLATSHVRGSSFPLRAAAPSRAIDRVLP